jgi:hypothetical protein
MAQAVSRLPLTAEARVRVRFNPCGIYGGQSGTGEFFFEYFGFSCKYIIPPHHEVCDCSDEAAHYHNLGPKIGASLLNRHVSRNRKRKRKKKVSRQGYYGECGANNYGPLY